MFLLDEAGLGTWNLFLTTFLLLLFLTTFVCMLNHAKSLQSWLTLCDFMDCGLPGSSVYGILQARVLEWDAQPFSRGSSRASGHTCISCVSFIGRQALYH